MIFATMNLLTKGRKKDAWKLFLKNSAQLEQVEAVVLGGSRAGEQYDQDSDYDVYVYLKEIAPRNPPKPTGKGYCSYMEIQNEFWNWRWLHSNNGIEIESIYRSLDDFDQELQKVLEHQPHNAYTTCMVQLASIAKF